jgi:hypothetical protein
MEKNMEFHTYNPRQYRNFRVVMRNLHPSTEVQDIKWALIEKGHEVTNVWNAKQRNTNKPLPIHFIDIKPHPNNKEIYQTTTLLHTVVKVEAPHVKRAIPQCMRCQIYGHTKNYCRNSPKCVKCAEQHLTSECPRNIQDDTVKSLTVVTSIQQTTEGAWCTNNYNYTLHCETDTYHKAPLLQGHINQIRQRPRTHRQPNDNQTSNTSPHTTHTQHQHPRR